MNSGTSLVQMSLGSLRNVGVVSLGTLALL